MLEREVEKYFKEQVENTSSYCLKFTSPGTRGVPDRIVVSDHGIFFVELKRPKGGRLSPWQRRWRKKFRDLGHEVIVIHDKGEVDDFVDRYLAWVSG